MSNEPAMEQETAAAVEMQVFVTDDRMHLVLWCNPCEMAPDMIVAALADQVDALGIVAHPTYERLRAQLKWCAEHGRSSVKMRVASGVAPTPPRHGEITWGGNFFAEGFHEDPETGAMDYRRPLAERTVTEGQLLATVLPPMEGAEGMDVFGAPLPADPASAAELKAGENVDWNGTSDQLYAARPGRIRLTDSVLHVDDLYCIEGSIGLATGNVDHPGALEVHGDIEAGTMVKARGDVDVTGIVEDAQVECTGSLCVAGGILGDGATRIISGGSVRAKFLKNACIEAEGDVEAHSSIDNCVIKCRGALRVPKGRIVGGEVTALGGIVVQQAGSVAAIPTVLTTGEDYGLIAAKRESDKTLQSYQEGLARLQDVIEPMRCREKLLSNSQRGTLTLLLHKAAEFEEKCQAVQQEMEMMLEDSHRRAKHMIVVLGKAYPDTLFRVHGMTFKTPLESTGPLQAVLQDGEVVLAPYKPAPPAGRKAG